MLTPLTASAHILTNILLPSFRFYDQTAVVIGSESSSLLYKVGGFPVGFWTAKPTRVLWMKFGFLCKAIASLEYQHGFTYTASLGLVRPICTESGHYDVVNALHG
ncbi:hypothetical protein BaRGS_00020967, partial [Batillaria attramentaria]